jgi:hypothetical protein
MLFAIEIVDSESALRFDAINGANLERRVSAGDVSGSKSYGAKAVAGKWQVIYIAKGYKSN